MIRDWTSLYKLQDRVLSYLKDAEHRFYLSGGTALARGYYNHRYSEDLDFFVNDSPNFAKWRHICIKKLKDNATAERWEIMPQLEEDRFGRYFILTSVVTLKLEFINEPPYYAGIQQDHDVLGKLDNRRNILANKIGALIGREEPKDMADIYWLCCKDHLDIVDGLANGVQKDAQALPENLLRALRAQLNLGVPDVPWIKRPVAAEYKQGIERLIAAILPLTDTTAHEEGYFNGR